MIENITHSAKSDIGLLRHNNEDHFLIVDRSCNHCDPQSMGMIFMIADGMGGHAAGEIASEMACEEAVSAYYRDDLLVPDNADACALKMRRLEESIWSAHHKITKAAREKEELYGMGTTLSALVLAGDKALIAHVGDSRIYRSRNNSCEKMTVDHTKNQALIDTGQIRPGHENNGHCGHILTQALGGYGDLDAVFTRVEDVESGDRFLLCTDGLHGHVTDEEIRKILADTSLPKTTCDRLVQAAIGKGGHDNVTVIVVQVQ
jgi:PPM family protein phosphatase